MDLPFLQSGEFYALSCAFLWAVAVVLFRKSGEHVPPVVLNLFKNNFGLLLLLISMAVVGSPLVPADRSAGDWVVLLLSGTIGIAVADSLLFASLNRLGAGRSAIVDCLYSPFVLLCAVVYLGEALQTSLLLAMGLVVAGILVGTWRPLKQGAAEDRQQVAAGIAMGVASMLLMAVGIVMAKPVLEVADVWWATTVRLVGAVPLLAILGATRRYRGHVRACLRPGPHWKVLIPGSFIGAYLALLLWIMGFKYTQAGVAGVLNQTSNLLVLILATLFLKEPLTWRKAVAIALGFAGATIVAV